MEKQDCRKGMKVIFGRGQGEKTLAEVIKINPKKAKVRTLETRADHPKGSEWGVPYSMLEAAPEGITSADQAPEVNQTIAKKAKERRSMRRPEVGIGTKFRSHYADGNPEWTVISKTGANWFCRIEEDADWQGTEKVFMTSEIQQSLAMVSMFAGFQTEHANFYESLSPGDIVHYCNGFGQYVRCEVVRQDMQNKLMPIALVGDWRPHDLPLRQRDGEIYLNHYPQMIEDRKLFDPNASNIWEHRQDGPDPRQMKPLDLSVPDMTADEKKVAAKWAKIKAVQKVVQEAHSGDPDDILAKIRAAMGQKPLV